jgi:hypothetical protein
MYFMSAAFVQGVSCEFFRAAPWGAVVLFFAAMAGCLGDSGPLDAPDGGVDGAEQAVRLKEVEFAREGGLDVYAGSCTPVGCPWALVDLGGNRNGVWFFVDPSLRVEEATMRLEWDALSPVTEQLGLLVAWCDESGCEGEGMYGTSPVEVEAQGMKGSQDVIIIVLDRPIGVGDAYLRLAHPQDFQIEGTLQTLPE